ncbi:hypothetical protein BDF14DRAFT_1858334 [Spinellus fusiger]|nr:hypothetical protein BDF14DRAFT_1858334 [Spinellus fusiger]
MSGSHSSGRIRETIINVTQPQSSSYSSNDYGLQDDREESPPMSRRNKPTTMSPKVEEIRKMIHLILNKLSKRKRPASSLAYLGEQLRSANVSDQFENDDTVDLLFQLRTALSLCQDTGLSARILMQCDATPSNSPSSSRSNSPALSPKSATTPISFEGSPITVHFNSARKDKGIEVDKILYLLEELITHDCRFKSAHPKPSRPLYTMQCVLVDIAILLVEVREDPAGLYAIGSTMLPSFETFSEGVLAGKLVSFYIDILLPKIMACKDEPRVKSEKQWGRKKQPSSTMHENANTSSVKYQHTSITTPIINIQSADTEEAHHKKPSLPAGRSFALTIDTRLTHSHGNYTPRSPTSATTPTHTKSPTQQHQGTQHQSLTEAHYAYALVTPLLFFMIQYLNPYLSSSRRSTQTNLLFVISHQSYAINNFHRALRFMAKIKPDLYLDVLDIISHSTAEVKFRACQVLFHYYFNSVGHVAVAEPLPKLGHLEEMSVLEKHRERQEYERNREQQQVDPTFLETMMGTNTAFNVAGINRKYRGVNVNTKQPPQPLQLQLQPQLQIQPQPPYPYSYPQSSMNRQEENQGAIVDEPIDTTHVWYPHMFLKSTQPDFNAFQDIAGQVPSATWTGEQSVLETVIGECCNECYKEITDYGLRCYQCKCSVHYKCYNQCTANNDSDVMLYVKEGGIQKVVSPQFCRITPTGRPFDPPSPPPPTSHDPHSKPYEVQVDLLGHHFHLVNMYTLMLCACCRLPLWGLSHQGYRCSSCNRFIHPRCLSESERLQHFSHKDSTIKDCQPLQPLLESETKIAQKDLCRELSAFYQDLIPVSEHDFIGKEFEEVSVMLNILLIQENILHCGVAAGCLLVTYSSDDPLTSNVRPRRDTVTTQLCPDLEKAIRLCTLYLTSGKCRGSSFFNDFYTTHQDQSPPPPPPPPEGLLLSKESYLSHLAAMIKSLSRSSSEGTLHSSYEMKRRSAGDARGFLQVVSTPFGDRWGEEEYDEESCAPQEMMEHTLLLSWIMENLHFKNKWTAKLLLQHMHNLGLFERHDASPILFGADHYGTGDPIQGLLAPSPNDTKPIQCIFPVPFAIDCSPTVEILIDAIEACFEDIDITLNECGMLLLMRRCWPDPFMSRYTTERLIHAILSWIFQEDEKLSTLYAEYTANKQQLPGVRQNKWTHAAQLALLSRVKVSPSEKKRQSAAFGNATGMSNDAGSVYVTIRSALRDRYVVPWLSSLHAMDPNAYATMLSDAIERIVGGRREECTIPEWMEQQNDKKITTQLYDETMGYILKLKSYGLTFGAIDSMLERWLNKAYNEFNFHGILLEKEPVELPNLAKLYSMKSSAPKPQGFFSFRGDAIHPFDTILRLFESADSDKIEQGICWITLLQHSSVGIPSSSMIKIANFLVSAAVPVKTRAEFIKLIWFQAVNVLKTPTFRSDVLETVDYINRETVDLLYSDNESKNLSDEDLSSAQTFIKYSLVLACFVFNCPLTNITELDIVPYFGDHVARASQNKRSSLNKDTLVPVDINTDTPIIRCIQAYLHYKELNVGQEIIKTFYALTYWGMNITNKQDFLLKCIPFLIPAIWDMLPPDYNHINDINLNLLMKLLNISVEEFHVYVYRIFDDSNWEVRYRGLDHLHGLFTNMDSTFQTKWLQLLPHLGPLFSRFVECLWDKEEYVRSKAFALIRIFSTLHIRSAFWCWEAYFMAASDRQRVNLVSLMVKFHALFPDWQVLQWDALIGAFDERMMDRPDTIPMNILEQTIPLKNGEGESVSHSTTSPDEDANNSKALMLSLALQMLSHHLEISQEQLTRIKFLLVEHMGFTNCQRYSNSSNVWVVTFDELHYDPKDAAQESIMISCSRGLKQIMDGFSALSPETVVSIASDILDQNRLKLTEKTSPGIQFIDVVLRIFDSSIDLAKIKHIILKAWLEIVLIIVYKHNILAPEYEMGIVVCIKQIIELLTKEISEENKLIILEILICLLRRSDHLTAMILSKQIMALGKLMTKLEGKATEPLFLKAKQLLKNGFFRFSGAGLFVLLFKNQIDPESMGQPVDLFYMLRSVIDAEDIVPEEDTHEVVYLRDQPVRDVIDKIMKQQMDRKAFSNILYNMGQYIETVHSHPYSETILDDYSSFLTALVKHTSDWKHSDWDISPVFSMSARLLKEHPYHFSILLPSIQLLFKHGISSCNLKPECIVKVMAAYYSISSIPGVSSQNVFADTIIEEVKLGMNNRLHLNNDTLLTLCQIILWDDRKDTQSWYESIEREFIEMLHGRQNHRYFENKLPTLLEAASNFLKAQSVVSSFTETHFKTYTIVSHLLVSICAKSPQYMAQTRGLQRLDETRHCLRFLSWFILGLLSNDSEFCLIDLVGFEDIITDLLTQTFNSVQNGFDNSDFNFDYGSSGEAFSLCFLVLKGWILLRLRVMNVSEKEKKNISVLSEPLMLWMSVWPALRRILDSIQLASLVSSSSGLLIWNDFTSLLKFLFACRSSIILVNAHEWKDFLDAFLGQLSITNGFDDFISSSNEENTPLYIFGKQLTSIRNMFDVPPVQVPATVLIDQLLIELGNIMRSQAENLGFSVPSRAQTTIIGV